jgi:hypothetical protein
MATWDDGTRNEGFDDGFGQYYQMIPTNGARYLRLQGGRGLTVVSTNKAVCEILELSIPRDDSFLRTSQPYDRFFVLYGNQAGTCIVEATGSSVTLPPDPSPAAW